MPLLVVLSAKGEKIFKLISTSSASRPDMMRIDGAFATDFAGLIFD
jgi:hypothetical protein